MPNGKIYGGKNGRKVYQMSIYPMANHDNYKFSTFGMAFSKPILMQTTLHHLHHSFN
jgi:hypothetical protein